ncbi:MAG: hypothetical protein HY996_01655 [Micrococcales bacterium]|nr:hypothetical protein [Micrococcales bacterium]
MTDVERHEWRQMVEALPRPARHRVYVQLERTWEGGPADDRLGYLASVPPLVAAFRGATEPETAAFSRGAAIMLAGLVGEIARELRGEEHRAEADRLLADIQAMPLRSSVEATRGLLLREARLALDPTSIPDPVRRARRPSPR